MRWREPIQTGYFYVFLAGMVWAALNIVQSRARKLNLLCVWVVPQFEISSFFQATLPKSTR